jgi:NitT/TauT family transport system permease protein
MMWLTEARAGRATLLALTFCCFLALWEGTIWLGGLDTIVLPHSWQILRAFWEGVASTGVFWPHLTVTFAEILCGFALGAGCGLILGVAIGESRILQVGLFPYLIALQTTPKVAIAPLFVVWFGFGMTSKVLIAAMISFFPVVINVITGLHSADPNRVEMLQAFCASRLQIFLWARLPAALPYIFAGLRISIALAVIGAIVAEFVGSQSGLGYLILQYDFDFNIAGIFSLLIILSALGVSFNLIMERLQRRIVFWEVSKPQVEKLTQIS